MRIKADLRKHRFLSHLSWIWVFIGLMVFVVIHHLHFAPVFHEQFAGDFQPVRPLSWGAILCFIIVGLVMMSQRRLPYSNNFEFLVVASFLATSALLMCLVATRTFYSGTYLLTLLIVQIVWFGMEVLFRNFFVIYKFGIFPASIPLSKADFPEHEVIFFKQDDAGPRQEMDAVVVDFNVRLDAPLQALLTEYQRKGVPLMPLNMFLEDVWGRIPVELLNDSLPFGSAASFRPYLFVKPILDRIVALLGLVVAAPIIALAVLAVRLSSPGSAVFRQERVGMNGWPFIIYKLRTMHDGMDKLGAFAASRNDERLTGIGRYLRKFHIDELPQLLNVLRGEMAIVGPRPETSELTEVYKQEIPGYILRNQVRPGVTSWALIHQGNVSGVEATKVKLSYDLYYLKHASCLLDAYIIIKTIWVIIVGIETLHAPGGMRMRRKKSV